MWKKEEYILLEFTKPPSVNECYTWYPKRRKSDVYKKWLKLAHTELLNQTRYKMSWDEWLEARITIFMPLFYKNWNKKKQDLDNFLKPIFDFLWDNIQWFKDEHIKKITAEKIDSEKNICKIIIKEIWTT